ncbi:MAG: DUF6492 family protein [Calothrix sp. MO_167.B12]|nr:DUF6492 family protein [Calothrix sp. MO_167.B12]
MNKTDFCLITPSYAPDFERCQLLCWSIEKFLPTSINHYIIVDRKDLTLFKKLNKSNTEIITVESVLPWWIQKIPLFQNGWFSFKTLPIRNWLLQQIVKLSIAQYINHDVFVFVDSDVIFVRPLNFHSFVNNGKIRFFREPEAIDIQMQTHYKWYETATQLLELPPMNFPAPNYIGNLITWKRENVFKLYQHLENISGRGWIETIASCWDFSEYILYGMFVDQVLKDESGHYCDPQNICHEYWLEEVMSSEQLQDFFAHIRPEHLTVMISAKSGMSVPEYQQLIKQIA